METGKYPKHTVLTRNGTSVRMNDAALKIAQKHFGVSKSRPTAKEVPLELLKMPKIDIIKAEVRVQPPVDEKKLEHDIAIESIKKTKRFVKK